VLLTIILATTSQTLLCDDTKVVNTEINCLAKAVYHEARGEPREGQLAIAKTVLNRVSDPKFPKSVCKVVYQPNQFTNIRRLVIKDAKAWDNALAIAYTVTKMGGKY
jgi:spore germination cell wall hydrolase CwlJ-like protein